MDTALPQKFPFILDRNLAKANCTENHVCTSYDKVVLGFDIKYNILYFSNKIKHDIFYMNNWRIILKMILKMLSNCLFLIKCKFYLADQKFLLQQILPFSLSKSIRINLTSFNQTWIN